MRVAKGNDGALKESELPAHDAHAVTKRDGRSDDTSGHTHGRVLGNRQRGQVVDSGHAVSISRAKLARKHYLFFLFVRFALDNTAAVLI